MNTKEKVNQTNISYNNPRVKRRFYGHHFSIILFMCPLTANKFQNSQISLKNLEIAGIEPKTC